MYYNKSSVTTLVRYIYRMNIHRLGPYRQNWRVGQYWNNITKLTKTRSKRELEGFYSKGSVRESLQDEQSFITNPKFLFKINHRTGVDKTLTKEEQKERGEFGPLSDRNTNIGITWTFSLSGDNLPPMFRVQLSVSFSTTLFFLEPSVDGRSSSDCTCSYSSVVDSDNFAFSV